MNKNFDFDTDARQEITGLILAGGQASRMGGEDKGLILLEEKHLIAHVIDRFKPQVKQIVISCNRNIDVYSRYEYPLASDQANNPGEKPQFNGPLAGILAGMASIDTPYTLIVPCDCPALSLNLGGKLLSSLISNNSDIAVPFDGERQQPLFLLIKTRLKDELKDYYEHDGRSIRQWLKGKEVTEVCFIKEKASFINLNTPEELNSFTQSQL